MSPMTWGRTGPVTWLTCAVLAVALAACGEPEPTVTPSPSLPVVTSTPTPTLPPTPIPSPTPTPVPLSLELPEEQSTAEVGFTIEPNVPAEGNGQITVTVTNFTDELIREIVVRWPTDVGQQLYLRPFDPSPDRMANPYVVPWTRWVEGPGSRGEPDGTTSLGWGPIDPDATVEIPIIASRMEGATGPIEFDVQLLDGNAILMSRGEPAQTRIVIEP